RTVPGLVREEASLNAEECECRECQDAQPEGGCGQQYGVRDRICTQDDGAESDAADRRRAEASGSRELSGQPAMQLVATLNCVHARTPPGLDRRNPTDAWGRRMHHSTNSSSLWARSHAARR